MHIEVIANSDSPKKNQGDVLENFAAEWLKIYGYSVTQNVRKTASELDLLCNDTVSGKQIYVECKAYNDTTLSANALMKMLGTVDFHDYKEGWFISTGDFGKDAKGFMDNWEKRTNHEKLSIFTPERIVDRIISANIIVPQTSCICPISAGKGFSIGEWILVLSEYGKYWATTVLKNGIPKCFVLFSAEDGHLISDNELIVKIKATSFSLKHLGYWNDFVITEIQDTQSPVVEVEIGENWSDYRPARPEHFVGRKKDIRDLFGLISDVKNKKTETRVFAIKGDSGIGKSSFVAKIREEAKVSHKPNNVFVYAVDMRAANDTSYIECALLQCLREAQKNGFGNNQLLELSNQSNLLESNSIKSFIAECGRKKQAVVLILDQFEELYSKTKLFPIFEAASSLMYSVISASSNFIIGFAWKTDCSIPQDHPAYYLWHKLSDLRYEINLRPFSHQDAELSLNMFESELPEKIRPDLRKYLLTNSQGYPWLLKKLCIHLGQQLSNGISQVEMENSSLDIASLFDRDLNNLSLKETACVRYIAKNAPADWVEALEEYGHEIIQSLQNKRLIIRRGDKLNLYWDIFRDYVVSNTIPDIPFNYIPQSTSIDGLLRVCMQLDNLEGKTVEVLAEETEFKTTTVRNIIHDLIQFGVVKSETGVSDILLAESITSVDERSFLLILRSVFKRHQLTIELAKLNAGIPLRQDEIITILKQIMPSAKHDHKTWAIYANKMRQWLIRLGYLRVEGDLVFYEDRGDVDLLNKPTFSHQKPGGLVFIADAAPAKVQEAFTYIALNGSQPVIVMKNNGFRNACSVLVRFGMLALSNSYYFEPVFKSSVPAEILEKILNCATNEDSVRISINALKESPHISAAEIGDIVSKKYSRKWSATSKLRIGGGLRIWAKWVIASQNANQIIAPPGRISVTKDNDQQPLLFDFSNDFEHEDKSY